MADVFVSYVSEDRARAEQISRGLEDAGFSVWWDRHIHGGVDFAKEIERQLDAAKIVVVLWSAASIESKWVRDEAQQARDDNKLIPVRLDATQPPLGFRQAQSLDFGGWNGHPHAAVFGSLVASARHFAGSVVTADTPRGPVPSVAPRRDRWGIKPSWLVVAAAVLAAGIGIVTFAPRQVHAPASASEDHDGRVEIGDFELLTNEADASPFARGLANAIARAFAASAITTVARKPGTAEATPTEFVLRGTVDRENGKFVVSIDVVQRRDDRVLWSAVRRQDTDDAGPFEEQVARFIMSVMAPTLAFRQYANAGVSADVLSRVLHYYDALADYKLDEASVLARGVFEAAPQLWGARVMQASAIAGQVPGKSAADAERLRTSAYENARAAKEMDPNNPYVAGLVDYIYATIDDPARGLVERERLLQACLAAAPEFAPGYYAQGYLLDGVGRQRDASSIFERLAKAQPLQGSTEFAAHTASFGHVDVARELFKADDRIWPTDSYGISKWFWAEFWYGDPSIAVERMRHPGSVTGNRPRLNAEASGCYAAVLEARTNRIVLSEAQIASACPSGTDHLDGIYAYFGHVDAAYRVAREAGGFTDPFDPYMRAVRADPRFMSLIARPELVAYWVATDRWPDFCREEKLPYDCKQAALDARAGSAE